MTRQVEAARRIPLNRERVLRAAVELADAGGIESLSMRRLAQELGVVPMALYKHVANKEELLDGMVDVVIGEIDPPVRDSDWHGVVRRRILSARQVLLRHRWASQVIESRTSPTPAVLEYLDSMIGAFRAGGLSVDLTHHVMHALGSRLLGFTQELFDDSPSPGAAEADRDADPDAEAVPDAEAAMLRQMAARYPHIAELALSAAHDQESAVGRSCDDQFEFEFALDLLLDGFERLRQQGWSSTDRPPRASA